MARQKVVDYIRGLLQKGYDISSIRDTMLKYGYSNSEINEAVNNIYNPTIKHEIHLGRTTIFVLLFMFLSVIGIAAFFYAGSREVPSKLLDVSIEPLKAEAVAGDKISFLNDITNLGSSNRYDIVIKQEVIDQKTSKVVAFKNETRAIETSLSTRTDITIPVGTAPGDYLLKSTVEYSGNKATATLQIKIISAVKTETCSDGIKNQDETGVDCGGTCQPCNGDNFGVNIGCSDNNSCTEDTQENGKCVHKPIAPCCGNGLCETGEESKCDADCKKQDVVPEAPTMDSIKETAKSNPSKAMQQCSVIDVPDLKDTCIGSVAEAQSNKEYCIKIISAKIKDACYYSIAKTANDNSICSFITRDSARDSCYMVFVVDKNDYTVCEKFTLKDARESCESLRQLYQSNNAQTPSQNP